MMVHRAVALLLLTLATGCASTRVVRLETGQGEPLVFTPRAGEVAPVELEEEAFREGLAELARDTRPPRNPRQAARQLFAVEVREGSYLFNPRTRRVVPLGGAELVSETEAELTRAYLRWCERTGRPGDCLSLLERSATVDREGRFVLALALAQGAVLDEMLEAFKDMADPHAMLAAALWTGTLYLVLWTMPEPVSKGVAAVMTATLVVYLGVDTFWGLIQGFRRLADEADRALTFDELRETGERYGKVMGRNAARAFALLATVAVANTAAGFASKVPTLPGSAQASMQAGAAVGIRLSSVEAVETVAVTGEVITMELAPGAVAMAARATRGVAATPVKEQGHRHHIATDKWWDATHSGGPWSPKFQELFDKAGMSLRDPANVVHVQGHKGPHPREYHEVVLRRLGEASEGCRTMKMCREALTAELRRLARELSTIGSDLHKLVTRTE